MHVPRWNWGDDDSGTGKQDRQHRRLGIDPPGPPPPSQSELDPETVRLPPPSFSPLRSESVGAGVGKNQARNTLPSGSASEPRGTRFQPSTRPSPSPRTARVSHSHRSRPSKLPQASIEPSPSAGGKGWCRLPGIYPAPPYPLPSVPPYPITSVPSSEGGPLKASSGMPGAGSPAWIRRAALRVHRPTPPPSTNLGSRT